jgi:hypothetical protein
VCLFYQAVIPLFAYGHYGGKVKDQVSLLTEDEEQFRIESEPGYRHRTEEIVICRTLSKLFSVTQPGDTSPPHFSLLVNIPPYPQHYWVFRLCPSSGIQETRKHKISETGSFPSSGKGGRDLLSWVS